MTLPLFIGGLGPPELLLIAGVLILLFGASKLPKLARSMGTATGEFKKGREEVEEELEELREGENTETPDDGDDKPAVEPDDGSALETERDVDVQSDSSTDVEPDRDPERSGT